MPGTPFDSALLAKLFPTGDVGKLFSDSAEVRAMMLVEGALAKVQGAAGLIPEISAAAINRAAVELQIDPGGLAQATGGNGVSTPALVAAFRTLMQAPEHAQYLHWGATSQDIQDSALMLRMRQVLEHYNTALSAILSALGTLAETHADLPVAARTYGQYATPTSFGAQAAAWGWPLLALRDELEALKPAVLWVSLAGAAGTASEMGENAADLRAALAAALGLNDPGRNWHNDRAPITRLAAWCARVSAALGKMGEDLILATQSGSAEVQLGASGGSSTMPQKQNPVGPSALVALGRHAQGLNTTLQGAAVHRQNRDGAAWFTEWLTLPQLCQSVAVSLHHAQVLAEGLRPMPQAMAEPLSGGQGLIYAEALSFALTDRMSRPDAQAEVKTMCKAVIADGGTLPEAALAKWPDLAPSLFDPAARMGQAPAEARKFASLVKG